MALASSLRGAGARRMWSSAHMQNSRAFSLETRGHQPIFFNSAGPQCPTIAVSKEVSRAFSRSPFSPRRGSPGRSLKGKDQIQRQTPAGPQPASQEPMGQSPADPDSQDDVDARLGESRLAKDIILERLLQRSKGRRFWSDEDEARLHRDLNDSNSPLSSSHREELAQYIAKDNKRFKWRKRRGLAWFFFGFPVGWAVLVLFFERGDEERQVRKILEDKDPYAKARAEWIMKKRVERAVDQRMIKSLGSRDEVYMDVNPKTGGRDEGKRG